MHLRCKPWQLGVIRCKTKAKTLSDFFSLIDWPLRLSLTFFCFCIRTSSMLIYFASKPELSEVKYKVIGGEIQSGWRWNTKWWIIWELATVSLHEWCRRCKSLSWAGERNLCTRLQEEEPVAEETCIYLKLLKTLLSERLLLHKGTQAKLAMGVT